MTSGKTGDAKLRLGNLSSKSWFLPRMLLLIGAAAATVIGCGWEGTQHSVRFNGYQTEREMGRLPPLPTLANGLNELRATWDVEDGGGQLDYEREEARTKEVDALWESALALEEAGDLRAERDLLQQYLEKTAIEREIWFDPKDRQQRRNSAIDRLDALSALERGSSPTRVRAYLTARRIYDADNPDDAALAKALGDAGGDPNLRDNVAYLNAGKLYAQDEFEEAAKAFAAVACRYPHSEKREAALFMSGVALMKTSVIFSPEDEVVDDSEDDAEKPPVAVDDAWRQAVSAFRKLGTENPQGRFADDARGWLAYLLLHGHDRAGALVEYYRLLADKRDENTRIEAALSLQLVRGRATDDEMARVEKILEREPNAALAYAYHNIFNYAIDPNSPYPPYEPDENLDGESQLARSDAREKEWEKQRVMTGRRETSRVLDFSRRLIKHYPNLAIGGAFSLRAAQASLELGDNESAVQFAKRAIQSRLAAEDRVQALWTSGVAEHRLRHFDAARQSLTTLLRESPSASLTENSRRLLAMIAEDAGDLDGALEQYLALDYSLDIAYFVDVLLTPEQLAGFVEHHRDSPKYNELLYALGVRYLRANQWADARKTLARVKPEAPPSAGLYAYSQECFSGNGLPYGCVDPKSGELDADNKPVITPALLMRDVQTANDLEALEQAAEHASGDEAKAEALYQLASYQHEASHLLFYNPTAWTGGRYWNLSELAAGAKYRATGESQVLWQYMQEHETFARALKIYLKVAQDYPRTRAARDALYTAAVCHERLSEYNPYWRDVYMNGLHAGQRLVTYADVKATYPDYQLPRGTYGWQPSTRTVNGGPGWNAPPKPKPRPTRAARLKQLVFSLFSRVVSFWELTGRHWALVTLLVAATLFVGRRAARARAVLRSQLQRQRLKANVPDTYPWMMLFQIEPVELKRLERAKLLLRSFGQRVWQLACDRDSGPVLTLNVVTHSVLTWLFVVLVQTLMTN